VTTGTVTGLANVTTAGLVISLNSVIAPIVVVTTGEVDPNATSTTTGTSPDDKKKQSDNTGNTSGSGTGTPAVTPETSAPAGLCH
jgi:hypothetical protein